MSLVPPPPQPPHGPRRPKSVASGTPYLGSISGRALATAQGRWILIGASESLAKQGSPASGHRLTFFLEMFFFGGPSWTFFFGFRGGLFGPLAAAWARVRIPRPCASNLAGRGPRWPSRSAPSILKKRLYYFWGALGGPEEPSGRGKSSDWAPSPHRAGAAQIHCIYTVDPGRLALKP